MSPTGGEGGGEALPELVLVHGLGSASSFWDNLRPSLDRRFHLVTPDLPGHGPRAEPVPASRSHPAALARSLVDQLVGSGVVRPHLVGISLGGWVVLEMAAQGYGRSVVSLAPAGMWQAGAVGQDRWERALRHVMVPLLPLLPVMSHVALARSIGLDPNVAHPERVTSQQFMQAAYALAQARGYAALDRTLVRDRFTAGERVTVPVTVAFGDTDRILPADLAQDFAELPPQAEVHIVESCGHAMTWDQPERCEELIDKTVARAG